MASKKVRCPKCHQRVKPQHAADRQRLSCPNCGAWFSTDDDDVLGLNYPSLEAAVEADNRAAKKQQRAKTAGATTQRTGQRAAAASAPTPPPFTQINAHLISERFDPVTRLRLFGRLREAYEQGLWDPELLYLGARYAVSLGRAAEAKVFLERLSELLKADGQTSPAYFPVGLLALQLATDEQERAALLGELQALAMSSSRLAEALRLVGGIQPEQMLPQSPPALLHAIEQGADGLGREVLQLTRADANGNGPLHALSEAQRFAQAASDAYHAGQLADARHALEGILMLDGDQPDVIRNLITVTSEQQDIEAYERYWRRYVKVLLWHIMRDDDAPAAYDELFRFYSKVATVTDREFNETPGKLGEKLRTLGLLPRWLEAHAGLIWLDSITRPHRAQQANLAAARLAEGWLGHLALMKYWYRIFYPEFYRYLDVSAGSAPAGAPNLRRLQPHARLAFDPALNLLTRFVEWTNIGFDLDFDAETQEIVDNEHTEKIMALVGCVVRVPLQPHVPVLHAKLDTDERNPLPFRRLWQEACSRPFRARRDKYLGEKNWPHLVALYGEAGPDPELLDKLTPMSRLFLGYALCQERRTTEGFEVACHVLPDLLPEEFAEESQTLDWWRAVFNMNLEEAAEASMSQTAGTRRQGFVRISERLKRVPPLAGAPDFIEARLKEIGDFEARVQMQAIMDDVKQHVSEGRYDAAIQLVKTLPETSTEARERKQSLLEQVRLEQAFDQCGPLCRDAKFKEAKALMRKLQVSSDVGKERRDEIIGQIERAEQNYKESERLNKLVDDAIARAKECIGRGAYNEARQVIRRLPKTPELAELKQNFLQQIDKLENDDRISALLDDAIKRAKECINRGAYASARDVIRRLPDTPPELAQHKRDFLAQIDKVEGDEQRVKRENEQILSYLRGRGVDLWRVDQIAREYKVDKNNPYEYNSLLTAVQKQVRGY